MPSAATSRRSPPSIARGARAVRSPAVLLPRHPAALRGPPAIPTAAVPCDGAARRRRLGLARGALVGHVPVARRPRALARALHRRALARTRAAGVERSPSPALVLRWTASRRSRRSRSAAARPSWRPAASDFEYIPALNDDAAQVDCLARLVRRGSARAERRDDRPLSRGQRARAGPARLARVLRAARLHAGDGGRGLPYPYAVVADGRLAIGLHGRELPQSPLLSFVLPGPARRDLGALERRGIEILDRRLGDDVFNEASIEAGGQVVRLLEARTHSPPPLGPGETSRLGWFEEYALPVADLKRARSGLRAARLRAGRGRRRALSARRHDERLAERRAARAPGPCARRRSCSPMPKCPRGSRSSRESGFEFARRPPGHLDAGRHALLVAPEGHAAPADHERRMIRAACSPLLLAAPAATAWVPCEQKGLEPPGPSCARRPPTRRRCAQRASRARSRSR